MAKYKVKFVSEATEDEREVQAGGYSLSKDGKWWEFTEWTGTASRTVLTLRAEDVESIEREGD